MFGCSNGQSTIAGVVLQEQELLLMYVSLVEVTQVGMSHLK